MSGMIRFRWRRECEDILCVSYTGNSISLSKTSAEATENAAVKLLEKRLRLLGLDFALNLC